jgi:hypothetical protein
MLLEIHDQATGRSKGRPRQELDALKRSALILSVTAWESFVEDTAREQLEVRLRAAIRPCDVQAVFNGVAAEWLEPSTGGKHHGPDLTAWTGDGWKGVIEFALSRDLLTFHTPSTDNTNRLFKKYLGVQIKKHWRWRNVAPSKAGEQLDALIRLRGQVVHRGRAGHPLSAQNGDIQRSTAVRALNLVYDLVDATETALGVSPTP